MTRTGRSNTRSSATRSPSCLTGRPCSALGDIGPLAAMPVMEGKCCLFKEFRGTSTRFPICLDTTDPDEIVRTVQLIAPAFGGINLEDISAPRCFEIEDRLKEGARHPRVSTTTSTARPSFVMAALLNAVKLDGQADRGPQTC